MRLFSLLLLPIFLTPAPATARGLADTHEELRIPTGKTVKLFRPKRAQPCEPAAVHHQTGKMPLLSQGARSSCTKGGAASSKLRG